MWNPKRLAAASQHKYDQNKSTCLIYEEDEKKKYMCIWRNSIRFFNEYVCRCVVNSVICPWFHDISKHWKFMFRLAKKMEKCHTNDMTKPFVIMIKYSFSLPASSYPSVSCFIMIHQHSGCVQCSTDILHIVYVNDFSSYKFILHPAIFPFQLSIWCFFLCFTLIYVLFHQAL